MTQHSTLVITPGDPDGIGPEITWKAIQADFQNHSNTQILCIGARAPFEKLGAPVIEISLDQIRSKRPWQVPKNPHIALLPAPQQAPHEEFLPGFQAGWSIQTATQLVLDQVASALVTGPISKERLQKGGYPYPGHTEFLAQLCGVKEVTMMLANDQLRVSLVTTHVAVNRISTVLTGEKIRRAILHTAQGLNQYWGISKPRIAVAALNPHAGESGLFGREEIEIIEPELNALKTLEAHRFSLEGPIPADTLFARHSMAPEKSRYDGVVCMYHDQGLIPVKLLDFPNTVNVTLGLPMIRTSVDHGVGFDIAGQGIADPSSLRAAIRLAKIFVSQKHEAERVQV